MIYKDGSPMDKDMQLLECPRCQNGQFSKNAFYCRICGLPLYNECEGDEYDNRHSNPSNARYCETCGAKTKFLLEGILKAYTDVDKSLLEESPVDEDDDEPASVDALTAAPAAQVQAKTDSDDDLPF